MVDWDGLGLYVDGKLKNDWFKKLKLGKSENVNKNLACKVSCLRKNRFR